MKKIKIFGLNSTKEFAEKVASYLDLPLSKRVNLVVPYLCYARMDRKTLSREPITTKYVAQQIEAMGVARLLTIDHHNLAALQNSFRINTDNLEAKLIFVDHLLTKFENFKNLTILSPDSGGIGRAQRFRNALSSATRESIDICYLDKSHVGKEIKGSRIVGAVTGKNVVILDDMISSAKTIQQCMEAVDIHGGSVEYVMATHGLFVGDKVNSHLAKVNKIAITDSIMSFGNLDENIKQKVEIVPIAELFSKAIKRTHSGGSISSLLTGFGDVG